MKAKIKKGLVFKSADGAVITVITMNIKSQAVTYYQVKNDVTSQHSVSKKSFEQMLGNGVGLTIVAETKKEEIVPVVVSKANDDQQLREVLAAKYVPNPQKANPDFKNMNAVSVGAIEPHSLALLGGKERFRMLDESKWLIKEVTATHCIVENLQTNSSQTFEINNFANLIEAGHLVLF